MAWFLIFVAGVFEAAWAIGLKYSYGFSKLVPSVSHSRRDDCELQLSHMRTQIAAGRHG